MRFETLGCIRVELKTDALNEQSRAAILRLGAKEEGVFRSHMITATGRVRDTVYYSIIDSEWPGGEGESARETGPAGGQRSRRLTTRPDTPFATAQR